MYSAHECTHACTNACTHIQLLSLSFSLFLWLSHATQKDLGKPRASHLRASPGVTSDAIGLPATPMPAAARPAAASSFSRFQTSCSPSPSSLLDRVCVCVLMPSVCLCVCLLACLLLRRPSSQYMYNVYRKASTCIIYTVKRVHVFSVVHLRNTRFPVSLNP